MKRQTGKQSQKARRHNRVRAKVAGTARVPRLCVFRSNNHMYAQLIDDAKGVTIAAANDTQLPKKAAIDVPKEFMQKQHAAFCVGAAIAAAAADKKIGKVVFDRAGYKYHGRVKALAEGARAGGLTF